MSSSALELWKQSLEFGRAEIEAVHELQSPPLTTKDCRSAAAVCPATSASSSDPNGTPHSKLKVERDRGSFRYHRVTVTEIDPKVVSVLPVSHALDFNF